MSRSSCSYSASSASSRVSALVTPLAVRPSGAIATYAYLVMSAPHYVDRPDDLGDGGDAGLDQPDRLLLKGPHPLVAGGLAKLVVRGAVDHEFPHGVGDG